MKENISMTMPYLSEQEVNQITKRFYHHLCDTFLEMIKTMHISKKDISERFHFTNLDYLDELEQKDQSVMVFSAHYANWEWMISLSNFTKIPSHAVYKRIANPHFDKLFLNIRQRFGTKLIEMKDTIRYIRQREVEGKRGIYGFISDQSPMVQRSNYWQEFMGIEVPVFTGGEALCKKYNMIPLYLKVDYIKRGHYEATFIPLSTAEEDASKLPNYELMNRFLKELEKQIHEAPAYYFWTHKRWKHRGKKPKNL